MFQKPETEVTEFIINAIRFSNFFKPNDILGFGVYLQKHRAMWDVIFIEPYKYLRLMNGGNDRTQKKFWYVPKTKTRGRKT